MEDDFDILNKIVDDWFDNLPLIDTNINSEETYENIITNDTVPE